jgi:hypothetical protein
MIELLSVEEISFTYRREKSADERAKLFAILPYAQEIERLKRELKGWETLEQHE